MKPSRRWPAIFAFAAALVIDAAELGWLTVGTTDHAYRPVLPALLLTSFAASGALALRESRAAWLVCAALTLADIAQHLPYSPASEPWLFADRIAKVVFLALAFAIAFRSPRRPVPYLAKPEDSGSPR
jgi:hypothetical protein